MKKTFKFAAACFCLFLLCAFSVSAEGGINANEQAVMEKIQTVYSTGDKNYTLPTEYVNQARNFFLTIDLKKEQSEEIIGYIDEGMELLDSQVNKFGSSQISFDKFDPAAKSQILELGQKATEVVGLKLVYSNGNVTITDNEGKTVFSGAAVIKVTGANKTHLIFGGVTFLVIAITYITCTVLFIKQKKNYE